MAIDEAALRQLEDEVPQLAALAVRNAYEEALASGTSVLIADEGNIYEVFPDGTRRLIKRIQPPTAVTVGQKLVLP